MPGSQEKGKMPSGRTRCLPTAYFLSVQGGLLFTSGSQESTGSHISFFQVCLHSSMQFDEEILAYLSVLDGSMVEKGKENALFF